MELPSPGASAAAARRNARLWVNAVNRRAIKVYERIGFALPASGKPQPPDLWSIASSARPTRNTKCGPSLGDLAPEN